MNTKVLSESFTYGLDGFLYKYKLAISFFVYFVFVWLMAFLRHDYMWIIGDDPNLLNQALMLSKGYIPNLDFGSGYPGLSLYPHAALIKVFGPLPITEHIYTALLATTIGLVFFVALYKHYSPYLISIVLLFIYFNSHFNNPSPNPGYGFEIFFILGLFVLNSGMSQNVSLIRLVLASISFAVAFCFKQYGIFSPIVFLLYSSLLYLTCAANSSRLIFERGVVIVLNFMPFLLFSYLYIQKSVLTSVGINQEIIINFLAFNLPWLSVILLLSRLRGYHERQFTFRQFLLVNAVFSLAFVISLFAIMAAIYGPSEEVFSVLKIILFEAPKAINSLIVYLDPLSPRSLIVLEIGILVTLLPIMTHTVTTRNRLIFFATTILVTLGYYVHYQLNTGGTLYLVAIYIVFIAFAVKTYGFSNDKLFLYLCLSPILSILTPNPDYAYHLAVIILFGFWMFVPDMTIRPLPKSLVYMPTRHSALIIVIVLVATYTMVIVKADRYLVNIQKYSVNDLEFVSGDLRWADEIERSRLVIGGSARCINQACIYIVNYSKLKHKAN